MIQITKLYEIVGDSVLQAGKIEQAMVCEIQYKNPMDKAVINLASARLCTPVIAFAGAPFGTLFSALINAVRSVCESGPGSRVLAFIPAFTLVLLLTPSQAAADVDEVKLLDVSSLPPSGTTGGTRFESMHNVDGVLYYVEYLVSDTNPRKEWQLLRFDPTIGGPATRLAIDLGVSQQGAQRPERLVSRDQNLFFTARFQPILNGNGNPPADRVGLWGAPSDQFRIDFIRSLSSDIDQRVFESRQLQDTMILTSLEANGDQGLHSVYEGLVTNVLSSESQSSEELAGYERLNGSVFALKLAYDARVDGYATELWSFPVDNVNRQRATRVKRIIDATVSGLPSTTDPALASPMWRVGDRLMFFANDQRHGCELWATGGNANDTQLIKDINPGIGDSVPFASNCQNYAPQQSGGQRAVVRDNTLYFYAFDGSQEVLWQSDGSDVGTFPVAESFVANYSPFALQVNVNGWTYYAVDDPSAGALWRTNGESLYTDPVPSLLSQGSLKVTELTVVGSRLFILTEGGGINQFWQITPRGQAPLATRPIPLSLRERDSNKYGARYGSNEHSQRVVFQFNSPSGEAALLTARGYDVDAANEVQVRLNREPIGFLKRSPNNALGNVSRFVMSSELINPGSNIVEFVQQTRGYKYGVTKVRVVPLRGEERTLVVSSVDRDRLGYRYGGGSLYPGILPVRFARTSADAELKFRAFDIDNSNEVSVFLNNALIAKLPTTANKAEKAVRINLPASIQQNTNLLEFRQSTPGYQWGVRNLLLRLQ